MVNNNRSKIDISNINISSNANLSNDEFTKEFSFLFKNISEHEIDSAIKQGDYKKYRKLIKEHNATFIEIPERSLSPLHHAVTYNNKNINAIKDTINSVLQSGIDINHPDEQGNTPLMHLLSQAASKAKEYSKGNLTGVMRFLIEHGASLGKYNESKRASGSDLIDELKSKKVITEKEIDDIYKAQQGLKEKAKKELSAYVQDIEDVSIYGSCAKIKLNADENEFKISEFLQSDFCKNNGISGFSTLHGNGKSGMHGVVSSEGVRHYVVTDGSYEMALKWYAEGKECNIKININADGTVKIDNEYLEQYKAGKINVDANKDVKLGNLFLAEALAKGRWKENEVQHKALSETIRSNSVTHRHEAKFQPVTTSTPLPDKGNAFFKRVFNEQNGTHGSRIPHVFSDFAFEAEDQQQGNNQPFTPFVEGKVAGTQNSNTSLQNSNQGRSKTPPPISPRGSSLPIANEFESQIHSKEAQEKPKQRQATREKNSGDRIYSIQPFDQLKLRLKQTKYRLKKVKERDISPQTKEYLTEAGLLDGISTGLNTAAESPNLTNASTSHSKSGSDSGYSSPTHTSHSEQQVDPEYLKKRLMIEHNEQIDSITAKLNNTQPNKADQVISELKALLVPDNTKISQGSNIRKLLEKDEAQLKIGVIEEKREDISIKPNNTYDYNKIALSNQCIKSSKEAEQTWVERITTADDSKRSI